jgi:hypothetical protein
LTAFSNQNFVAIPFIYKIPIGIAETLLNNFISTFHGFKYLTFSAKLFENLEAQEGKFTMYRTRATITRS